MIKKKRPAKKKLIKKHEEWESDPMKWALRMALSSLKKIRRGEIQV